MRVHACERVHVTVHMYAGGPGSPSDVIAQVLSTLFLEAGSFTELEHAKSVRLSSGRQRSSFLCLCAEITSTQLHTQLFHLGFGGQAQVGPHSCETAVSLAELFP